MTEFTPQMEEDVAEAVAEAGLLVFENVTRKDSTEAPFYFDIRKAQSYPRAFKTIVGAYSAMVLDTDRNNFLAGIPIAGTPFASVVGFNQTRRLIQPRGSIKAHGIKKSIEGVFEDGEHVVLLDDTVVGGKSKFEAIEQIEEEGLVVERLIVLLDGEQGGMEAVQKAGYDIRAGFTITALINHLQRQEAITPEHYQTITDFIHEHKTV